MNYGLQINKGYEYLLNAVMLCYVMLVEKERWKICDSSIY